jgi:hypothetical protein
MPSRSNKEVQVSDQDESWYWLKRAKALAEHEPLHAAAYALIAIAIQLEDK